MLLKWSLSVRTWVLDEIGLHQVIEDVVLTNPLHGAAAGGAKRRTLHPAWVAGSTEDMHARLQAKAKARHLQLNSPIISIWWTCCVYAKCLTGPQSRVQAPNLGSVWMTRSLRSYLIQSCSRSWQMTHVRLSSILSVLVPSTEGLDKRLPRLPLVEPTTSVLEVCGKSKS